MLQFLIERDIPDAGRLTPSELRGIAQQISSVLRQLNEEITWVHSYVTDDKFYCLYEGPGEALVREHSRLSGLPVTRLMVVRSVLDPMTAE